MGEVKEREEWERMGRGKKGKEGYGPIYFIVFKEEYGAVAVAG